MSRSAISSGHFVSMRADGVEEREPAVRLARAHQRDAEVELPVEEPVARPLPVGELGDRLVVALPVQEALRDQQPPLGLEFLGQRAGGLAQRPVGLLVLAGRIEQLAEIEPGAALHVRGRRRVREQPLEDLARLAVLAERQVETAAQELGVARVRGRAGPGRGRPRAAPASRSSPAGRSGTARRRSAGPAPSRPAGPEGRPALRTARRRPPARVPRG